MRPTASNGKTCGMAAIRSPNGKRSRQKAVERRVGEKNPELMGDMPKVLAALLEARKQADALAREQQAKALTAQRAQQPESQNARPRPLISPAQGYQ